MICPYCNKEHTSEWVCDPLWRLSYERLEALKGRPKPVLQGGYQPEHTPHTFVKPPPRKP